jgi:hypothetical protein
MKMGRFSKSPGLMLGHYQDEKATQESKPRKDSNKPETREIMPQLCRSSAESECPQFPRAQYLPERIGTAMNRPLGKAAIWWRPHTLYQRLIAVNEETFRDWSKPRRQAFEENQFAFYERAGNDSSDQSVQLNGSIMVRFHWAGIPGGGLCHRRSGKNKTRPQKGVGDLQG